MNLGILLTPLTADRTLASHRTQPIGTVENNPPTNVADSAEQTQVVRRRSNESIAGNKITSPGNAAHMVMAVSSANRLVGRNSEKMKTLNPEMTRQLVKMIARPLERSELVTIPTGSVSIFDSSRYLARK